MGSARSGLPAPLATVPGDFKGMSDPGSTVSHLCPGAQ